MLFRKIDEQLFKLLFPEVFRKKDMGLNSCPVPSVVTEGVAGGIEDILYVQQGSEAIKSKVGIGGWVLHHTGDSKR